MPLGKNAKNPYAFYRSPLWNRLVFIKTNTIKKAFTGYSVWFTLGLIEEPLELKGLLQTLHNVNRFRLRMSDRSSC